VFCCLDIFRIGYFFDWGVWVVVFFYVFCFVFFVGVCGFGVMFNEYWVGLWVILFVFW